MRNLICLAALAALTACSSGQSESAGIGQAVIGSLQSVIAERLAGPRQQVVVTPELLAETKVDVLQINPEVFGGSDFLQLVGTRTDSTPGKVEFWRSSDNAHVILRDGIVVGSRGIGADIISSDASLAQRALRTNTLQRGARSYTVSDGDSTSTDMQFQCEVRPIGEETLLIVQRKFGTNHLRETCTGGLDGNRTLENEYWVQPASGVVLKSRQWMGPRTGYFELIFLEN